jgi:large subunit ribosomal protein L13
LVLNCGFAVDGSTAVSCQSALARGLPPALLPFLLNNHPWNPFPGSRTEGLRVRTYSPKASEITRTWFVVDAEGMVLGRLATEVARLLRGKHKPTYAPHIDTGDHVIIINADKIVLTSNKGDKLFVHRHSGYPGGLRTQSYGTLLANKPEEAVRGAIRGMLPHNRLGRQQLTKLKVYAGPVHPHAAQSPETIEFTHAKAR